MLNIFYLLLVLCIFGKLYPFWTFLLICNKHWEWYKQKCFFNTCFWNVTFIVTSVTSFHHIKLPTSKQQIDGIMGFYWWQTHKGITIQTFNANKKVLKIPKHGLLYMSTIMYCRMQKCTFSHSRWLKSLNLRRQDAKNFKEILVIH